MTLVEFTYDDDDSGTGTVTLDATQLDPDMHIEALRRGLAEMFQDRYNEAKANLAQSVLGGFLAAQPEPMRKVG